MIDIQYEQYFTKFAAAFIRGDALDSPNTANYHRHLLDMPLEQLTQEDIQCLLDQGCLAGIKLYPFKRTHENLPRVRRVLGFLKSVSFDSLFDVGSGRGVFLLPFLEAFPWVEVTSVDLLEHRVEYLKKIKRGGISNLTAMQGDLCCQPLPDKSCDVVTLLEVLEHIPDVESAVKAAVRIARKHVVVTVPSKEDDNPEHIHLLTKQRLTQLFEDAGCNRLHFDGVNGHLFMVVTID